MRFEWDENKRTVNIEKHGLDFSRAVRIFDGFVLEWDSPRESEHRTKATGMVEGRYITVIYTWRGSRRRIISARPARKAECERYEQAERAHH